MMSTSKAIRRSRTDRVEIRQEDAEKRNGEWKKLTPEKQLADLDARLGKGVGAAKQRAKLQSKIESAPAKRQKQEDQAVPQESVVESKPKKETKKKA
jgi:hypothetical protein